jgi:hypothetical protein
MSIHESCSSVSCRHTRLGGFRGLCSKCRQEIYLRESQPVVERMCRLEAIFRQPHVMTTDGEITCRWTSESAKDAFDKMQEILELMKRRAGIPSAVED